MAEKQQPPVEEGNVLEIDVPKIALDERFGSLKFDNASDKLLRVQRFLREAHDLQFRDLLISDHANQIDSFQKRLVQHLQWLQKFDLSTSGNPKGEHDNFEREIDNYYKDVYKNLVMVFLPFLREERRRENPEEKALDEEVRQVTQLRSELQDELKKVREETEKIRTTNKEVGAAKGERAAVRLAAHFDGEAKRYQDAADGWYKLLRGGYIGILLIICAFAAWYLLGEASLTWQSGGAKLVLIAALWYGLSFLIRNYNVNSHLAAVNRHRAAVARTLDDFIAVEQQQEKPRMEEMLRNATEAMFKHAPIGFISRAEKDNSSPVYEVINNIIGSRSTQ